MSINTQREREDPPSRSATPTSPTSTRGAASVAGSTAGSEKRASGGGGGGGGGVGGDNHSPPPSSPTRTKKPRVAGSRTTDNLTPEQLAKKRANDREAQRANRERTKRHISNLEGRIHELMSQEPYQQLEKALQLKKEAQSDNENIRRTLISVLSIIEGALSPRPSQSLTTQNALLPEIAPNVLPHIISPYPDTIPSPLTSGSTAPSILSPLTIFPAVGPQWQPASMADNTPAWLWSPDYASDPGKSLLRQLDRNSCPEEWLKSSFFQTTNRSIPATTLPGAGKGAPQGFSTEANSPTSTIRVDEYSPLGQVRGPPAARSVLPLHCTPTCPLDSIFMTFLSDRQRQAAGGEKPKDVLGPKYPSIRSLLNPEEGVHSHPVSKVFTDVLSTFPTLTTLPERIGLLYVTFLFMRWAIYPTAENYDRLPKWMALRPAQALVPHPAWTDYIFWPAIRNRVAESQPPIDFDEFATPYISTLNVNWPYEPTDTLILTADSENLMINPVFERHLRNLDNWSLGPEFKQAYPALAELVPIKPKFSDQASEEQH